MTNHWFKACIDAPEVCAICQRDIMEHSNTPRLSRLMVIGHAHHGKDTVCEQLRDEFGFTFMSSSFFVAETAVRPWMEKHLEITYPSLDACYADRVNWRAEWHEAIAAYNANDPARLGRELFKQFDIYCGLRSDREFQAMKVEGLFDVAIWVDRSQHLPPEPYESMKLTVAHADIIIDNNGGLEDLRANTRRVLTDIMQGNY